MVDEQLIDLAYEARQKNPDYGHNLLDLDERNFVYVLIGLGIALLWFIYSNSSTIKKARRNLIADLKYCNQTKFDEDNWDRYASPTL
mmetsp:Transcript_13034/g.24911  ORF Transcript_13034/g.24911 Transcript_13034/m.24911 type:complete len:87 (-) Transcript_13034:1154-1414(-)